MLYVYYKLLAKTSFAVVSYWPVPLLGQIGLYIEQIIVPFSSKGMKHVVYMWPQL